VLTAQNSRGAEYSLNQNVDEKRDAELACVWAEFISIAPLPFGSWGDLFKTSYKFTNQRATAWLLEIQELLQIVGGAGGGSGERELGEVVGEDTVDLVELGGG
jgi:hypothetical protein